MISKLYRWYGKRTVWAATAVIASLVVGGLVIHLQNDEEVSVTTTIPTVQVASAQSLAGSQAISLLGTVRAVSEADIQSEVSGRVTGVSVSLGDTVAAGSVIATLENASERAAVLQAEGVYEAALAASQQSDIGVTEAQVALTNSQNSAVSAIRSAYTTNAAVVLNTVDEFFADPQNFVPGLRIDGGAFTNFLNAERRAYESLFTEWQQTVARLSGTTNIDAELTAAIAATERTSSLIDVMLQRVVVQDPGFFSTAELKDLEADLLTARNTLNNTRSALDAAQTGLVSAREALNRASVGGSQGELSAANAQVKQALGALRAAEANLAKTVLRSPIAGTINSLNVNVGDFLSSFTTVAKVANNNALEVTVFVGERDLSALAVGTPVLIDNTYPGTVTNIGAGVDAATQKTEVKIATETNALTNGDTVTVSLEAASDSPDQTIVLPITAVKFANEDGFVFTVENGQLVQNPVTLGAVRGAFIEIMDGIAPETQVVVDARGLTAGANVEAIN